MTGLAKVGICHIWKQNKKEFEFFCKTLYCRCWAGLWIYLRPWYGSNSKYARVVYIWKFWIYQCSEYAKVVNIPRFWLCQGFEDNRILNILGFWIYQGSEYVRVLNMPGIPYITSETNPPPSVINVVCKYLRQFLGTSFGVAALPICCNVDEKGGAWFISAKWTIPELTWSQ